MDEKLSVFVAMPGDFGPEANYKNPQDVRNFFRSEVAPALEKELGREIDLVVEKERPHGGFVHESMFRAAWEADIFIADLTGRNANVFLELGIRFALRRGVTILVSQDESIPFNVGPMRVIRYANAPDRIATRKIVDFARNGLGKEGYSDSPVMDLLDLKVVKRRQWEQVAQVRLERWLRNAKRTEDPNERLALLRSAVEEDPWSLEARLRLVREYRLLSYYQEALNHVETGLAQAPEHAPFHQEKGLILGKMDGRLRDAVIALERARELDGRNTDILSNLGGALRRLALQGESPAEYDHAILESAIEQYQMAYDLNPHDTYSGLNVVRLLWLISGGQGGAPARDRAKALNKKLQHLCAYEVENSPQNYWRRFDLMDARVFSNRGKEAIETCREALEMVPKERRSNVLESPRSTWKQLRASGSLTGRIRSTADEIIEMLSVGIASEDEKQKD